MIRPKTAKIPKFAIKLAFLTFLWYLALNSSKSTTFNMGNPQKTQLFGEKLTNSWFFYLTGKIILPILHIHSREGVSKSNYGVAYWNVE